MSKTTVSRGAKLASPKASFTVKPVKASAVAAIVLEELSREYHDVCNFSQAVSLVRGGDFYLASLSIGNAQLPAGARSAETSARITWVYSQAQAVVKKCVDSSYDPWPETSELWFRTEERCRKLNKKFSYLLARSKRLGGKPVPFASELKRFCEGLLYVLGSEVPVDDILLEAHYGPGSSVGVRGQDVNFVRKVESNECVPRCVDLAARALVHDKATWAHLGLDATYAYQESAREGFIRVAREQLLANVTSHDRLMFIFKNMTSLRSIGAQPTCSGIVQLGVHTIGARLLQQKAGIDLSDQGWNQRLAREGSLNWEQDDPWCTLDKSNASNLIANGIVQNFFPQAWSQFLQRTRTPGYIAPDQLGGGAHTYHMYAGMGNGTTFFVETLVFWAATFATQDLPVEEYVKRKPYAVYGDDVILRRSHAESYMELAQYLGFQFNMKKTFLEGPFRESCGGDYYAGVPVRPATLKSETGFIDLPTLVSFHNNLADNKVYSLKRACERIRHLSQTHLYPIVPTDPQGNLGFRPVDCAHYSVVRDKSGAAIVSPTWQRPRTYKLEVKPKFGDLGKLDPWTMIAVSLLRAKQEPGPEGKWSLPIRDLVNHRIIPERDLERGDLIQMLGNQLCRLLERKAQPWWKDYRG